MRKFILLISLLALTFYGCGNKDIELPAVTDETPKETTAAIDEVVAEQRYTYSGNIFPEIKDNKQ